MTTLNATQARKNLFSLIKNANKQHKAFHIQHAQGAAVLLAEADYEGLLETLKLLSIPNFRKKIGLSVKQMQKGDTLSMKEVFGDDH